MFGWWVLRPIEPATQQFILKIVWFLFTDQNFFSKIITILKFGPQNLKKWCSIVHTCTWEFFYFDCFLWEGNEKELQIVFEKWSNSYFNLDIRPKIQIFNELYLPCDHTGWLDRDSHWLLMNPDWRKIVWKPNTVTK